jgi:hypothetical protein
MQERIQREALDVRTCLTQIRDQLTPVPFPFDHATVGINAGDYLIESLPEITDYGNLLEAASGALPRYSELTHRVAAELCRVAATVEESFGFPPLPLPPEPEPDSSGDSEGDA